MQPRLIALYSPAPESGKSTAAQYLIDQYGYSLVKIADTLKVMARTFLVHLGVSPAALPRYIEGDMKNTPLTEFGLAITPRQIMQSLGSEWGRDQINTDVWPLIAGNRIKALLASGRSVVVDDLRFPNELEMLRGYDALVVAIVRDGATSNGHASDGAIDFNEPDHVVQNNGSVNDLHRHIRGLVTPVMATQ